jgi:hypothetical protein
MKNLLWTGLVWAAGCATSSAEPVNESAAKILAEHDRTGEVRDCLNVRNIGSIQAVDERTLLIRSGVSDYYVSDLKSRCSGSTSGFNRFEYTISTGSLCRNDIIRIVDNTANILAGSCGMGSFEKLEKKPAVEPAE